MNARDFVHAHKATGCLFGRKLDVRNHTRDCDRITKAIEERDREWAGEVDAPARVAGLQAELQAEKGFLKDVEMDRDWLARKNQELSKLFELCPDCARKRSETK